MSILFDRKIPAAGPAEILRTIHFGYDRRQMAEFTRDKRADVIVVLVNAGLHSFLEQE